MCRASGAALCGRREPPRAFGGAEFDDLVLRNAFGQKRIFRQHRVDLLARHVRRQYYAAGSRVEGPGYDEQAALIVTVEKFAVRRQHAIYFFNRFDVTRKQQEHAAVIRRAVWNT